MSLRITTPLLSLCLMGFLFLSSAAFCQSNPIELTIQSKKAQKGDSICIDVTAKNFRKIESLQFSISFDATLVTPGCPATFVHPSLKNSFFGELFSCGFKDNGFLNFVWASDTTTIADNEVLFTLCFKVIGNPGNKSPIRITGDILDLEVCAAGVTPACTETFPITQGEIEITTSSMEIFTSQCEADGISGAANGSMSFYVAGGKAPYTFTVNGTEASGTLLEGSSSTFTLPNLAIDKILNIIVTDSLGEVRRDTVTIIGVPPWVMQDSIINPRCWNSDNGSIAIDLEASQSGLFTFRWSNLVSVSGVKKHTLSNLRNGKYTVTITNDTKGCTRTFDYNLFRDTLRPVISIRDTAACNQPGAALGSLNIDVSGGTPFADTIYEFSYNGGPWSKFKRPTTISNVRAGNFTFFIRDSLGCTVQNSNLANFTMPIKKQLNNSTMPRDISCYGKNDGSAFVTMSPAGNKRYDYTPIGNTPPLAPGTQNRFFDTITYSGLAAGLYSYRVIDTDRCADTINFLINQPDSILITDSIVEPGCNNKGSINLTASGGVGGFTYAWSLPGNDNSATLDSLNGGAYTVTISDVNKCSTTRSFTLNNAGSLSVAISDTTHVSCAGLDDGRAGINVQFAPGSPIKPFKVFWRRQGNNTPLASENPTITNLTAGNYSVIVIDSSGCKSDSLLFRITEPPGISINSVDLTNARCFDSLGRAVLNLANNLPNTTFAWTLQGSSTVLSNTNTLSAKAGTYNVRINQGVCPKDTSIEITQPAKISIPIPETRNVVCFGQTNGQAAILTPGNITYRWSSGDLGQFSIRFPAGQAWVMGTNPQGCVSDTLFFNIGTNPKLKIDSLRTQTINPACFQSINGSISVEASGGTGVGYKYLWENGTTSNALSNLRAGKYKVTLSDNNNCEQTDSIVLTQPTELIAYLDSVRSVLLDCKSLTNGRLAIVTSGGNAGIKTIQWQPGVVVDNNVAIGLQPGTYTAVISDNRGCRDTFSYTMTAPPKLTGRLNIPEPILCNGGSTCISVAQVAGGTGNRYRFQINNGTIFPIDTCLQVKAGQYFVAMLDESGCSVDTVITINQPAQVIVNLGPDKEISLGDPPLQLDVLVVSANPVDSVKWTPIENLRCLNIECLLAEVNPDKPTTYRAEVIDANGCRGTDEIYINVKSTRNVYFPNVFSPNKDGFNDYFQAVTGRGIERIVTFSVFDRWGNKVFDKQDYLPDPAGSDGWDGTHNGRKLDPGVFVYFAKVLFIDQKVLDFSGSVTLIESSGN